MSLKITISGAAGEGKTALAIEIKKLIKKLGMAIQYEDIDAPYSENYLRNQNKRIHSMLGRKVLIETVQVRNKR
jgi:Ni2+-binding GTPase involved in maturation of urease and hydrogenase